MNERWAGLGLAHFCTALEPVMQINEIKVLHYLR